MYPNDDMLKQAVETMPKHAYFDTFFCAKQFVNMDQSDDELWQQYVYDYFSYNSIISTCQVVLPKIIIALALERDELADDLTKQLCHWLSFDKVEIKRALKLVLEKYGDDIKKGFKEFSEDK